MVPSVSREQPEDMLPDFACLAEAELHGPCRLEAAKAAPLQEDATLRGCSDGAPQYDRNAGSRDSDARSANDQTASWEPCSKVESPITDKDLEMLRWRLEEPGGDHEDPGWEVIVDKEAPLLWYTAKRRDPKDGGPTEYLSTTRYSNCSAADLRDFFMDSDFLVEWDGMVRSYRQVAMCAATGVETGCFVKKYPFASPREYVLAWRLWQHASGYYCCTRAVDHALVPRQQKPRRVEFYECMWRIRAVPGRDGRDAAEITLHLQEDNGMPRDLAKMAFRRGVWGYIRKTEHHLRQYLERHKKSSRIPSAISLIKVLPSLKTSVSVQLATQVGVVSASSFRLQDCVPGAQECVEVGQEPAACPAEARSQDSQVARLDGQSRQPTPRIGEQRGSRLGRLARFRPQKLMSSLAVLGGAVVLTHGGAPFGLKVATAFVLRNLLHPS